MKPDSWTRIWHAARGGGEERRSVRPGIDERLRLASLRPGESAQIVSVAEPHRTALDREGMGPGATIRVETAMPFGGPLVVSVGRARVAVARAVAASVEVLRPGPGTAVSADAVEPARNAAGLAPEAADRAATTAEVLAAGGSGTR